MELAGDVLTDALAACADGHSLLLRAATPKAFLPKRIPLTATAGASDGVYAAVDEVDTTAVLNVFQVADGVVSCRDDGEWVEDRDTLTHLLAAGVPLALLPQGDVPSMLRQIDDHDAVFPIVADVMPAQDEVTPIDEPGDGTPDFSDGVMVALPLDDDTAQQLAVPGGLDPGEMHVTLAYLGNTGDCPVDADGLAELVAEWAAQQQPLSGEVSGPATFEGSDNADNPVQVALADVPGLPEARQSLLDHLAGNGIEQQSDHAFTPHVTRQYGSDPVSTDGLGGTPLNFDQVGVWHGTDQRNIPLGPVTAAFNPSEARDPTGKWTAGGGSQANALEANRKTTAPHAVPKAKTVIAKPYKTPKGAGGGGGSAAAKKATAAKKAAASKAAQVQKAALRARVAATEKAASAAETAQHQKFLDAQAASLLAEQQHRIDYMRQYAAASPAQRKAMRVAEAQRRLAWQTRRAEASAKETARHTAAVKANAASKAKLDAQLKAQIAAIDAQLAKQFPPAGTPAPPPKAPVKASAEPLVADAEDPAIDVVGVAGLAPGGVGHRLQAS